MLIVIDETATMNNAFFKKRYSIFQFIPRIKWLTVKWTTIRIDQACDILSTPSISEWLKTKLSEVTTRGTKSYPLLLEFFEKCKNFSRARLYDNRIKSRKQWRHLVVLDYTLVTLSFFLRNYLKKNQIINQNVGSIGSFGLCCYYVVKFTFEWVGTIFVFSKKNAH